MEMVNFQPFNFNSQALKKLNSGRYKIFFEIFVFLRYIAGGVSTYFVETEVDLVCDESAYRWRRF